MLSVDPCYTKMIPSHTHGPVVDSQIANNTPGIVRQIHPDPLVLKLNGNLAVSSILVVD